MSEFDFQHIVIQPGDKLIFKLPKKVASELARALWKQAVEKFGENNIMVFAGDIEVTKITFEDTNGREDKEPVE